MASQSDLTIGGIGADPSGTHPLGSLNKYWVGSVDDMAFTYKPSAETIITDPGASAADATDLYYSQEISFATANHGMEFYVPSSADAQIKFTWQFYNPTGESFNGSSVVTPGTPASQSGGTWADIGSGYANTAGSEYLTSGSAADEDAVYLARQFRVKMTVTDAGSNGVAAGLVTAAVAALNHVSTGAYITANLDKQAKYNTGISIGGLGVDPS